MPFSIAMAWQLGPPLRSMPRKLPTTYAHPPSIPSNASAVCTHCRQDSEGAHHAAAQQDATSSVASWVVETADEHANDALLSDPVIVDMAEVESVGSDTEDSGSSHMLATAPSPSALADAPGWCHHVPSSPDLSDAGFTLVPRPAPAALSNRECSGDIGLVDPTPTQGLHAVCDMLDALHISASLATSKMVVDSMESVGRATTKAAPPTPEMHLPDSPTLPQMFCDLPQGDRHLAVPSLGTPLGESDADADADGGPECAGAMARRRRRRRAPRAPKAWRRTPTVPGSSPEPARLTRDERAAPVLSRRRPAPEDDSDEALDVAPRPKRRRRGQAAHAWRTVPPLPYSSLRPPPEHRL
ncbi:unnamed protein product [Clonostachys byssicola]|uniref:Uncharacterized protein n=1 Tax=Clonostachys byssicola TaxID=160290 RepID=A0A9N9XZ25_9HYPO|nr:unnamed protein product [Clonostachys byssicola]